MKKNLNSKDFWINFARMSWEKKPLLVKDFASPLREIGEDQIFSMLVSFSNQCRKTNCADGIKFYASGQRLHEDEVLQLLPLKSDRNLKNYHKRMAEMFADYCLVCDELLQVSQPNREKLKSFNEKLFSHVGFPNRFVEIGLYLGNYRKTPFGVHVDGCGVFSFPIVGRKVFRLWAPEFGKKNPALDRSHEYAQFKKFSKTLTAQPGDMTYWPSTAWHIAESSGSFSATWSLGVWVDLTHQQKLETSLKPLLKTKFGSFGAQTTFEHSVTDISGNLRQLPKIYLNSILTLKRLSANELHDACMRSWIVLSSAGGFKTPPLIEKKRLLTFHSQLQIEDSDKIQWCRLKSEAKSLYAFRGTLAEGRLSPELLKLIKTLNLKKTCKVNEFLKGAAKKQDLQTLQILCDAGAFG